MKFIKSQVLSKESDLSDIGPSEKLTKTTKCLKNKSSYRGVRRRRLYLIVFMFFGILLASCSSNSTGSSATTSGAGGSGTPAGGKPLSAIGRIQLASTQLTQGKTVQMTMTGSVNISSVGVQGGKIDLTLSGTGNLDSATHYYSMNLSESFPSGMVSGSQGGSVSQQVVMANNTMYVKSSSALGGADLPNQWYSMSLNGVSSLSNSSAMEAELENPSSLLKILESVGSVTSTSSVSQNGQNYTQYKLNISFGKMMSLSANTSASSISGCLNSNYTIPVTILIDSQNQLHSLSISMNEADMFNPNSKLASLMGSMSLNMDYSLVFSNYGKTFSEFIPQQSNPLPGINSLPSSGSSTIKSGIASSMC